MKINRFKKSQKILTFYANNFNYHEPYQVLIDATFCQAALQHKVIIEDQLRKYFQSKVKLLTTHCVILEAESLGGPLIGATKIVKQFYVHKCGHEGKPISAAFCIKSMTRDSRYIVATQDRALQVALRKIPGRCLLYLHKATPVLEAPSEESKKYVARKMKKIVPADVSERIKSMKEQHGLDVVSSSNSVANNAPKHKRRKNPNPLSCKKSKKKRNHTKSTENRINEQSHPSFKSKRRRIKLPTHVKETFNIHV